MDQVLHGLEKTSDHMATTLNMPPVDIAGLRREWEQLKEELATIPPKKVPGPIRYESGADNGRCEDQPLHGISASSGVRQESNEEITAGASGKMIFVLEGRASSVVPLTRPE